MSSFEENNEHTRREGFMHRGSSQHYEQLTEHLSFGERLVRTNFNPSNSDPVHQIKAKFAELANICHGMKGKAPRLAAIAITKIEDACHYAVKAATGPDA